MARMILCCPLLLVLLAGCRREAETPSDQGAVMKLTSPAFAEGEPIPKKYAGDGENRSPPLKWTGAPLGDKSFALIADDPDAPTKTWVHWVIWNVAADTQELGEGVPTDARLPDGAKQGKNDAGGVGYGGPAPPAGKAHRYFFKLYALDATLDLKEGTATKADLEQAMKGHIIGHGQLMGTYQK